MLRQKIIQHKGQVHQSYHSQEELESLRGRVRRSPEAVKVGFVCQGKLKGNMGKRLSNIRNQHLIYITI